MADPNGIDILMRIVTTAGSPAMVAESRTAILTGSAADPMLKDFAGGQFCELREFDFSAGVESSLKKKQIAPASSPDPVTDAEQRRNTRRHQSERTERPARDDFVDMQPVGYTRIFDSASTLLFKALTECTTLASISIVKRKAAGTASAGLGYLRLDFSNVLMIGLDWTDGEHLVIESGTFIYRSLAIQYRAQKPNGALDVAVSATWQMRTTRTGS